MGPCSAQVPCLDTELTIGIHDVPPYHGLIALAFVKTRIPPVHFVVVAASNIWPGQPDLVHQSSSFAASLGGKTSHIIITVDHLSPLTSVFLLSLTALLFSVQRQPRPVCDAIYPPTNNFRCSQLRTSGQNIITVRKLVLTGLSHFVLTG